MSDLGALSPDEKKRLQSCVDQGVRTKQEVKDLNEAMRDLTKRVAEELNLKPADISKAITYAFKQKFVEEKDSMKTVEDILDVTGHG